MGVAVELALGRSTRDHECAGRELVVDRVYQFAQLSDEEL